MICEDNGDVRLVVARGGSRGLEVRLQLSRDVVVVVA